jgi:general secretion pathway protein A
MHLFNGASHSPHSKVKIWKSLETQLRKHLDQGNGSVLIIDEAQVISDTRTLEELRMLLNLQSTDKFLLNVILLGQLELEERIGRVAPLRQRIAIRYRLEPLPLADTMEYINHRLKVAGSQEMLFSEEACKAVFTNSGGIPREINNLCDRSLLAAFIKEKRIVSPDIVEEAWKDLH